MPEDHRRAEQELRAAPRARTVHDTAPASTVGPVGAALPAAGSSVTANVLGRAVSSTRGSDTSALPSERGWNTPAESVTRAATLTVSSDGTVNVPP